MIELIPPTIPYTSVGENYCKNVGTTTEFIPHPKPMINLPIRKITMLSNVNRIEPINKQISAARIYILFPWLMINLIIKDPKKQPIYGILVKAPYMKLFHLSDISKT